MRNLAGVAGRPWLAYSAQVSQDPVLACLFERFGHRTFRGVQEPTIRHFLDGGSALVLMATGEGKSLCYQLPAVLGGGLTLVVSPLIALMEDQVQALQRRGIAAACVHSLLDRHERQQRLDAAVRGELSLLYVTPERFRVEGFLALIRQAPVRRLAIDEAHCLSHWGHDFRPDYLQLGAVREALGALPCLALTATATPAVQEDIKATLGLQQDPTFHAGIERPNLFVAVHECADDEQKLDRTLAVLSQTGAPAIVYFALIADLLRQEERMQRRGLRPLVYHGDLSAHERKTQQRAFEASKDGLILATNAFGMGVDKPDIRAIVHWQIPRTVEAYYQEIGRAGRDGQGSYCELLWQEEDLAIQRNFVEWANPDAALLLAVARRLEGLGERLHAEERDDLVAAFFGKNRRDGRVDTCMRLLRTHGCIEGDFGRSLTFVRPPTPEEAAEWLPPDKRRGDLEGLLAMVRYASAESCRKQILHAHFGFSLPVPCGSCDRCVPAAEWLATALPQGRSPLAATTAAIDSLPVRRGDWIEVEGLGLCCVRRVHQERRGLRADVEAASDLAVRSVDLERRRWRKVQADD